MQVATTDRVKAAITGPADAATTEVLKCKTSIARPRTGSVADKRASVSKTFSVAAVIVSAAVAENVLAAAASGADVSNYGS